MRRRLLCVCVSQGGQIPGKGGCLGLGCPLQFLREKEREQVGRDLLEVGLEMLSQRGLKGTTLQDILQAVGISKPFFYGNYYTSLAELVIHIINYEITLLLREVQQSAENQDMGLEETIHHFLDMVTHSRQHHFFVMTQEEEMWVYKHLSPEDFETYQQGQARFYEQVLALWQIPQEKCLSLIHI